MCMIFGFILWANKQTNIANSDKYKKYKYALLWITVGVYGLICASREIIQNGKFLRI